MNFLNFQHFPGSIVLIVQGGQYKFTFERDGVWALPSPFLSIGAPFAFGDLHVRESGFK